MSNTKHPITNSILDLTVSRNTRKHIFSSKDTNIFCKRENKSILITFRRRNHLITLNINWGGQTGTVSELFIAFGTYN